MIEFKGDGLGPFALGGDSGSLVLDEHRHACALIFAVSDEGGHNRIPLAYANHISLVLSKLGIQPAATATNPGERP